LNTHRAAALALMLGLAAVSTRAAEPPPTVDLALVLAIDSSASIDDGEYALQMAGIAAAFRDRAVWDAIGSGPTGRIAVAAFIWAQSGWPKAATPWFVLDGPDRAEAFAATVERFPRSIEGGTGIGSAVMYGVRLIDESGLAATRRVIDLFGDGKETVFREWRVTPGQARFVATARGVTVNGLAILDEEPALDLYYRDNVIAGPNAFVMTAGSIADFARAMREKLLREIEYQPVVGRSRDIPSTGGHRAGAG